MPATSDRQAVSEQVADDFEDHVERLQRVIRQPTLSVDRVGLEETAELAVELLEETGFDEAELVETAGVPGVWGYSDEGAEKTVVTYGMLDTRLVTDEDDWDYPPFGAERTEIEPYGEVVVGRATAKAAFVSYLDALASAREALGSLPVNVMVLAEVEELVGSPHYYEMLDQYDDRVAEADACFDPALAQTERGDVTAALGYKSGVYFDLEVSGEAWGRGPANGDLHAMSNAAVDAPAWRLVDALASLTEENGTEISVPGFYDQHEPATDEERRELRDLIDELGIDDPIEAVPGVAAGPGEVARLKDDLQEDPEEALVQALYGVESFNLQGLRSGFLGPETNTERFRLPDRATASFDVRLPRGYDPEVALGQIRDHLDAEGFEDVDLDVLGIHRWSKTDRDADLVTAVEGVLTDRGADLTLWPYTASGVPWAAFASRYDVPVLHGVGLGHQGTDGPHEFVALDGTDQTASLAEAEVGVYEMLAAYAEI
ncbi:M20/M25/M40 family metallo-hydrolase [Halorussus litoreus]|uniref:M20/M25/M40 family metallo-hydrolase n=1 Tax=Halorussus litoreus TaxID=1710536 RepID=UPI000E253A7E|nr:M20/M25/M40 family metallo-hydrolase [Halorussus litoreus]